jgi:hypothetical protein
LLWLLAVRKKKLLLLLRLLLRLLPLKPLLLLPLRLLLLRPLPTLLPLRLLLLRLLPTLLLRPLRHRLLLAPPLPSNLRLLERRADLRVGFFMFFWEVADLHRRPSSILQFDPAKALFLTGNHYLLNRKHPA